MKKLFATFAIGAAASLVIVGVAQAQVTVPPGQDFYATPMNKGPMMMMPMGKVTPAAPPAGKMMMKKKMMKKSMKKRM